MITVNVWCASGKGGVREMGRGEGECSVNGGDGELIMLICEKFLRQREFIAQMGRARLQKPDYNFIPIIF